jgi:raffinose/stachyose/melibiose transport system substrate-binding protein
MRATRITAAALLGLALTVAGCSDPGSGEATGGGSDSGQPVAWPEPTSKLDGQTITIWAAQNSNAIPKAVAASFESATGAKINIVTVPDPYEQGVQTKVASGDKPDLAFWQPTASQLTAINAKSNLVAVDDAPFLGKYKPALKDVTGILDGTRYATLVTVPAVEGVWYNKEVFAQHGIAETPKNFDEMIADARKIKAGGGVPFYEMGKDKWATQWWVSVQLADAAKSGLWEKVNKGEAKFTDPEILGAIEKYKALVDEGLFNKDINAATFEDQGEALLSGQAAMVVQVNTFFSQLQARSNTAELNQKIGFFPISPSGNVGTFIPDQSNALVVFKTDAKREAAAKQFLRYWIETDYANFVKAQNTVSILQDVESPADVPTALTQNADSIATSVGSMQVSAIVNPDLFINLANMLAGEATPQAVAETTQAQFAQLAQAIGAAGF